MKYQDDYNKTLINRSRLRHNKNLLDWYKVLFEIQFGKISDIEKKRILEVGSGTSPIKIFYPNIMISDILNLDYLDYVFDCHEIDKFSQIPDESIDIITMSNVLHHLQKPIDFLLKSSCKLKSDGMIIITEPYYSYFSHLMYHFLHHEPSDFNIKKPELSGVEGPLAGANHSLPYLIFFSKKNWKARLKQKYDVDNCEIDYFTCISYPATGGISHCLPIPNKIYNLIFKFDYYIAKLLPNIFASFYILRMKKNEKKKR